MKKNLVLRTILVATIMAFLLIGCGKAEVEPEEVPEVTQEEVKEPEVEKEEEAELQEEEQKEEEPEVQEEVVEEEKASNEMPEAQVTTTVADNTEFAMYMSKIGETEPHVVIYNEVEGYVIDMKEGEYYQLKANDRIFFNWNTNIGEMSYSIPEKDYISTAEAIEIIPDYEKFDNPLECRYKIVLKDDPTGERIKLTCYLDAPAE